MLGYPGQFPQLSPLQAKGAAVKSALDEAIQMGASSVPAGSGAPASTPGTVPPNAGPAPLPAGQPSLVGPPGGGILPQRPPSSPVMGALQQAQQRPGMTPANPLEVKRPASPAAYAQASGPIGFARGGYVDLKVMR